MKFLATGTTHYDQYNTDGSNWWIVEIDGDLYGTIQAENTQLKECNCMKYNTNPCDDCETVLLDGAIFEVFKNAGCLPVQYNAGYFVAVPTFQLLGDNQIKISQRFGLDV